MVDHEVALGRVFLSYTTDDRPTAVKVRDLLAKHYDVFMDAASIPGGTAWVQEIAEALETCGAMVVLSSPSAWEPERWVRREVLFAARHEKPVIPVLLDGDLPLDLIDRQFIDGRVDPSRFAPDLLAAIRLHLEPTAMSEDVDALIGAAVRVALGGEGARAADLLRQAWTLDAALPGEHHDVFSRLATRAEPSVAITDLAFVERTKKLAKSRYRDGRDTYRWSVQLQATDTVLDQIASVTYELGKFYRQSTRIVRDRSTGFRLSEMAWGPLFFPVRITFHDGSTVDTWMDLMLRDQTFPAPTDPFPFPDDFPLA